MTPAATFTYNASGGLCAAAVSWITSAHEVSGRSSAASIWIFVLAITFVWRGRCRLSRGEGTQCGCGER